MNQRINLRIRFAITLPNWDFLNQNKLEENDTHKTQIQYFRLRL